MSRDEYQLKKNSHAEASGDFRDSHRLSITSLPGISLNMVYLGVLANTQQCVCCVS